MRKQVNGGFTLIELLVVVLIIVILAPVAVPQYQKAVAKARAAEAISILKAITDAQEVYFLANGDYTDNIDDLDVEIPENGQYYIFACYGKGLCWADSKRDTDPVFEFIGQHVSGQQANRLGKHWCHYDVHETDEKTRKKQTEICKAFGPEDASLGWPNYYIVQ